MDSKELTLISLGRNQTTKVQRTEYIHTDRAGIKGAFGCLFGTQTGHQLESWVELSTVLPRMLWTTKHSWATNHTLQGPNQTLTRWTGKLKAPGESLKTISLFPHQTREKTITWKPITPYKQPISPTSNQSALQDDREQLKAPGKAPTLNPGKA